MGSGSPTRDGTCAPYSGSTVLTTGPRGKSLHLQTSLMSGPGQAPLSFPCLIPTISRTILTKPKCTKGEFQTEALLALHKPRAWTHLLTNKAKACCPTLLWLYSPPTELSPWGIPLLFTVRITNFILYLLLHVVMYGCEIWTIKKA